MPRRHSHRLLSTVAPAGLLVIAVASGAWADTDAFQPASPQPTLSARNRPRPASPVVDSLMDTEPLVVHVRRSAGHVSRHDASTRHRRAARHDAAPAIARPALAGVELLRPLPRPGEPPHIIVPLPAYGLDAIASTFTMPAPPIVCHPARRDPTLPDPRLYREHPVICEADNP